tara:strand:+ start:1164 stop:1589 length:426 start_codon:yes stop_codon:yes gene_type:complete
MPFVKVDALIDDFPASGIYEKVGNTYVWDQISPDNNYRFRQINSAWTLLGETDSVEVTKETSTGGDSVNPKSATWVKYTVVDWVSPDEISVSASSLSSPDAFSLASPSSLPTDTFPTVTPTPGSPDTYPTSSPSPSSPNQI